MVIMLDGFLFRCLPLRRGRRIEDRRAFLVGQLLVVGSSDCVRAALENHLFGTRFKGLLAFIREMSDLCHQGLLTHGQGRTQCPLPRPNSRSWEGIMSDHETAARGISLTAKLVLLNRGALSDDPT